MSDACQGWLRLLERLPGGTLTLTELGALEDHISCCPHCRLSMQSDSALREVLAAQTGSLGVEASQAFDERVIAAYWMTPSVRVRSAWRAWLDERTLRWPVEYVTQVAGGALAAACVTVLCLFPTLHPGIGSTPSMGLGGAKVGKAFRTTLPVSWESLLSSPSPREAALWQPAVSRRHSANFGILDLAPRLPSFRSHRSRTAPSPDRPERRSSLDRRQNMG